MVLLIIMDGWGHGPDPKRSAISAANTPNIDRLYQDFPSAELLTHGENVGLPEGQMGNSEVGHINIGAGRVVYQELARINKSIREGSLGKNEVLVNLIKKSKAEHKRIHLIGLLSDGGVHSHINHLKALADILNEAGVEETYIHAFLDGRDTDPKSGIKYVEKLTQHLEGKKVHLASIIGRYYAMDRDNRWERTKKAYDLLVNGIAEKTTSNPVETIRSIYESGVTDEFMQSIVVDNGSGSTVIEDGDIVINFNFRTDRPRQITEVLTQSDKPEFEMNKLDIIYASMTLYDASFTGVEVMFTKDNLNNTLGEVLSYSGKSQLRIAETEKYPHVSFFFSGGREDVFHGESRIMVQSPKVDTYDLAPEMSAEEITDKLLKHISEHTPDFVCLNFANADMVGHTGDFNAAIKAAETVDRCVKRIIDDVLPREYKLIIIADHGNSDYMINDDGSPNTAHTTYPVPIILVGKDVTKENTQIKDGVLADVAPTILQLLGIQKPEEMDGNNLISY